MSSFSQRLKDARLRLGLTQEQLGFELDVTKASVSAWENGREAPGFRLLNKLREVLGVSLDELVCGAGPSGKALEVARVGMVMTRNEDEVALLKAYRKLPVKRRKALVDMLG